MTDTSFLTDEVQKEIFAEGVFFENSQDDAYDGGSVYGAGFPMEEPYILGGSKLEETMVEIDDLLKQLNNEVETVIIYNPPSKFIQAIRSIII
jgi:hypothetical protein